MFEEIRYRDTDHAVDNFAGQVTNSFVHDWSAALGTFTFTADVQPC
jgi:hypothetical protein